MPYKSVIMQLASCSGCQLSILNGNHKLLPILQKLDIKYWPMEGEASKTFGNKVKDREFIIGFIDGVARTKEETEKVKLLRKKCQIVVCIGACACYGGIKGLANLYDKSELLEKIEESTEIHLDLENYIVNIKDIIDIDMFIPGCPPTTENILATLLYLLSVCEDISDHVKKDSCVCDHCNLANEGCLLDNNKLCYGSITTAGCELMCPHNNQVCYGCFKNTEKPGIKAIQLKDKINKINTLTKKEATNLQHFLNLYLGSSNMTNFYYRKDLIQRLAYEPESFSVIEIETNNGIKFMIDSKPTGNKTIDEIIGFALYLLKGDENFKFSSKSVCSHCDRDIIDKVPTDLIRDFIGLPNIDQCFLEQGYLCLGPVTQAGCGTKCPNKANAPCLGCYGAPVGIKEQGAKYISTLGSLCAELDPEEVSKFIKDPVGLFNRFSVAETTFRHIIHDKEVGTKK